MNTNTVLLLAAVAALLLLPKRQPPAPPPPTNRYTGPWGKDTTRPDAPPQVLF